MAEYTDMKNTRALEDIATQMRISNRLAIIKEMYAAEAIDKTEYLDLLEEAFKVC